MSKAKVMVALRDKASVEGLVSLACQLANGTGAELIVLHAVQVLLATPLKAGNKVIDQEGKEVLPQAERLAAGKVPAGVSKRLVRARNAGEAIIAEAKEQAIDLLVLGHRRQHELSEFLLGSTMRHVAHRTPCKMIVQIPAPSPRKTQTVPVKGSMLLAPAYTAYPGGITL